jgi:hypothetical protein
MRTRLRELHASGRAFTWTASIRCVPGSGDCHRCIRVRVQGAGKNSRPLQADLLSTAWPAPWGACASDDAYPTAADVRAVIGCGLARGWDPDARGGTFLLAESSQAPEPELTGFLVTDRLQDPGAPDPTGRVIRASERQ